jgi:hypothetical protein
VNPNQFSSNWFKIHSNVSKHLANHFCKFQLYGPRKILEISDEFRESISWPDISSDLFNHVKDSFFACIDIWKYDWCLGAIIFSYLKRRGILWQIDMSISILLYFSNIIFKFRSIHGLIELLCSAMSKERNETIESQNMSFGFTQRPMMTRFKQRRQQS